MTKVLVLGATGYIGGAVAKALARAGHEVVGTTRDVSKNGKALQQAEVKPLQSDPNSDDYWLEPIGTIDAIVDCLGGSAPIASLCKQLIEKAEAAAQSKRHATAGKLTYVWTSGYLLHNDDAYFSQSELTAALDAPSKVSWRLEVESRVTSSKVMDGVVVRPPLIYGGSGSITGMIFKQALSAEKIVWAGAPGLRWPTAHVEDVAQAFRLVVAKVSLVRGLVLDVANPQTESLDALLSHLCIYVGKPADAWSYKKPNNALEEALARTVIVRSLRANSLLGWSPVKLGLIDGLPGYVETYKSFQST